MPLPEFESLCRLADQGVPATQLAAAYRICQSSIPLHPTEDDEIRMEFTRGRGDRLARLKRVIRNLGSEPSLHFVSGSNGSGKSTELRRLASHLAGRPDRATEVLYLDALRDLDVYNVDLEDILLALWNVIYRDHPEAADRVLTPIWKNRVQGALQGLKFELPDVVGQAVSLLAGNLRLQAPEQRLPVRRALGNAFGALIEGLNRALNALRPDEGTGVVVVLVDNLEKSAEGQQTNVEHLYLTRMTALRSLDAHLVITVPYYLCYSAAGASLSSVYGHTPFILPAIHVRRQMSAGGEDDVPGLGEMTEALLKRVDFEALFENGREAAEKIARASGGCMRHAFLMVQNAIAEHDDPPVAERSVARAMKELRADFERALPEAWVPELHHVAEHNSFSEGCPETTKKGLLRHLFVLEYQNGDPDPWHAVHPLVEQCAKYRRQRDA